MRVIATDLDHPEAVVWDADRRRLFCGAEAGQLYAVELDGRVEVVADTGGSLLGLALDASGIVFACDTAAGAVVAIDPDTGAIETVSRGFVEPNGIALGPDGSLLVGCSGTWGADDGVIVRIDPAGETAVWSSAAPGFPNGCLVRGAELLVVESRPGRVVSLPLASPGIATVVCELDACVPDQLALDVAGRMYVGCYRPDLILLVDADGSARDHVRDPSGMALASPTGLAFAGADLEQLVATNFGGRELVRIDVATPGAPVARPARTRVAGQI